MLTSNPMTQPYQMPDCQIRCLIEGHLANKDLSKCQIIVKNGRRFVEKLESRSEDCKDENRVVIGERGRGENLEGLERRKRRWS